MFHEWRWTALALPPRHFSWRVRGNPLYWSLAERECLEGSYDLLIATSMVDLATLRGLVPALTEVPTVLYFHENQFAYPQRRAQRLVEAQMVSLYAALAADSVVFNSRFNRETFASGCSALLRRLPDYVPRDVPNRLQSKSSVLPVPLMPALHREREAPSVYSTGQDRALRLLWSGRFEHDKNGRGLYLLLQALERSDLSYELAITGQQFRNSPDIFRSIESEFSHRLVQFGYVDDASALACLQDQADVVISTALHEFQGLAVMQAVMAGCVPLVPDRLAYREFYPQWCRYRSCPEAPEREAEEAAASLCAMAAQLPEPPDLSSLSLSGLKSRYLSVFGEAVDRSAR